jgi:Family of unknown function (DUF5724)/Domain of unknown function (DUF4132)
VADALVVWHQGGSAVDLLPYEKRMSPYGRASLMSALVTEDHVSSQARIALLQHLNDPAGSVRGVVLTRLAETGVTPDEAVQLEAALTTKRSDVRRRIITVLTAQPPDALLATIERLRAAKHENLRRAADELVSPDDGDESHSGPTSVRGLGLVNDALRSPKAQPVMHPGELIHPIGLRIVSALRRATDELGENLLTQLAPGLHQSHLSIDDRRDAHERSLAVLATWWEQHHTELLDGLPPFDALCHASLAEFFRGETPGEEPDRSRNPRFLGLNDNDEVPPWLVVQAVDELLHETYRTRRNGSVSGNGIDAILNIAEHVCARVAEDGVVIVIDQQYGWPFDRRTSDHATKSFHIAQGLLNTAPEAWTIDQQHRLWKLQRWIDEPTDANGLLIAGPQVDQALNHTAAQPMDGPPPKVLVPRSRVGIEQLLGYMSAGIANEHDLFDHLVGDCAPPSDVPTPYGYYSYGGTFPSLAELTRRRSALRDRYPFVSPLIERTADRVLDIELPRGDLPTAATIAAFSLNYLTGMTYAVRTLQSLGDEGIKRGFSWGNDGDKAASLSRLLRVTFPADTDTPADFAVLTRQATLRPSSLLALAVFAPQWAAFVEEALGWTGLADAAWWVCAHTKDERWRVDQDVREQWAGQISERTPLEGTELLEGAVDVQWFNRAYSILGEQRWRQVYDAAKFASSGIGHSRAKLFADAILGQVSLDDLMARISKTRHQDAVRAIGLVPFKASTDTRARYEVIHKFAAESKKFGSQRRESEATAVRIALANLARTAGYRDTLRLSWSMEAELVADLAAGPVIARVSEVEVALMIDPEGVPLIETSKNGKTLAAVPPSAKKDPAVAALIARHKSLNAQVRRMRTSLESMMVRGDVFSHHELSDMLRHPMVAVMLRRLLVIDDPTGAIGRPATAKVGPSLMTADGTAVATKKTSQLRIAHGTDFSRNVGQWVAWQSQFMEQQERQPFKQVFRELYVPTEEERSRIVCERFAGHQVNPSRAAALLTGRGWTLRPYEGASITFHEERITAWIDPDMAGHMSQVVEAPTISGVSFAGEKGMLALSDVPVRVFSEVLRDLDLVVSVAHVGGVDPEASQSTVEMRAALVETTARLLRLDNVHVVDQHVRIDGKHGRYDVHLGSGTVFLLPRRSVCIVAVSAQHRGRIFLPFADDDPRTAEVVSKVVLLARDHEIKDPTILSQLR